MSFTGTVPSGFPSLYSDLPITAFTANIGALNANYPSSKLIDNDLSSLYASASGTNHWVSAQLTGGDAAVTHVAVWQRQDGCARASSPLVALMHSAPRIIERDSSRAQVPLLHALDRRVRGRLVQ